MAVHMAASACVDSRVTKSHAACRMQKATWSDFVASPVWPQAPVWTWTWLKTPIVLVALPFWDLLLEVNYSAWCMMVCKQNFLSHFLPPF